MNELTLDGKTYVSSKRAAEITGYAKDYVGQLCREGHVEARLVGRNWYVLESSIRDHRFGKEATVQAGETVKEVPQSWSNPKYIPEDPAPLPVFAPIEDERVEAVIHTAPEETRQGGAILTDMEAAWREWFTRNPEEIAVEPVSKAEEEIEEVPVMLNQIVEEQFIEEDEPEQEVELIEVQPTDTVLDLAHREEEADIEPAVEIEEIQQVRISPIQRRRPPVLGNKVLQSLFIALALLSASIAAIGTGYAQKIVGTNLYRLSEINFIAGVSEINR